jgi:hypothetical protein
VTNSHRKFNQVDSLNINGAKSKNPVEIQEHMVHYYNKLYFEQCSWRPRVDDLSFLSIDADECFGKKENLRRSCGKWSGI